MRYYIQSMLQYISKQLEKPQGDRLQLVIPKLSGKTTLALANKLSEYCFERGVALSFKVAQELALEWTVQEQEELRLKGYLAQESLTELRNRISNGNERSLLILVGSAVVTDRGSLADFHQCNFDCLWRSQMKKSFSAWIEQFFQDRNLLYFDEDIKRMDSILQELENHSDIMKISNWLETVEISSDAAEEAIPEMLTRLDGFGLPNLSRSINRGRSGKFKDYVANARDFFSYSVFMEPSKREDALKHINDYMANPNVSLNTEQMGPLFDSEEAFFDALKEYVSSKTRADSLKQCDFVFIWEDILKYKPSMGKKERKTVKKLNGAPLEVFLHALLLSLSSPDLQICDIKSISFLGKKFKHDYFTDEISQSEDARNALVLLIGGVDAFLKGHIQIRKQDTPEEFVEINSRLFNEEIMFESSKTAEPYFEFEIAIELQNNHGVRIDKYALKLPETHPYRLATKLLVLASKELDNPEHPFPIPVFHLNYYRELMSAKDENEICNILLHCINESGCRPGTTGFMENLFTKIRRLDHSDKLKTDLDNISSKYKDFVFAAVRSGLYSALETKADNLIGAFNTAADKIVEEPLFPTIKNSAAILFRAFLIIGEHKNEDIDVWGVKPYEKDAVVTILHPSLIEILKAQNVFLVDAFNSMVNEVIASPILKIKEKKWRYYVDMAEIKMPLGGLLTDSNDVLSIDVRGKDLVHRIMSKNSNTSSVSTRLMTRYDLVEEDDVSDADLFRETRESNLLRRILEDYRIMHPHAQDGISLAVYRNDDIQPVLSALNSYLKEWVKQDQMNANRKYSVSLVIFSDSADDTGIINYLEEWQERWESAENEESYYAACNLSLSHRIVSPDNQRTDFEKELKENFECDIIVFYNFIVAGQDGNQFKIVSQFDYTKYKLKFPILEKAFCVSTDPAERLNRSQIISNRQFRINAGHTEIMARKKNSDAFNQHHVILGTGNYGEWKRVVDAAHEAAEWVVCIDPNIDYELIAKTDSTTLSSKRRELIGFGSGVGIHGESNYTISTEKFTFDSLKLNLKNSFKKTYDYGNESEDTEIVNKLLDAARHLSGLSIFRALGPNYYRCDFIAYCLTYIILPVSSESHLCNQLFSVDAYRHWFDLNDQSAKHPDLLWMRADIINGRFSLRMTLFECKMRKENPDALKEAKEQIQNGLDVLVKAFSPRKNGQDAPDSRFWYLQLHRLIACSTRDVMQEEEFLSAMELLTTGDFDISWSAGILAFWTDWEQASLEESHFDIESNDTVYDVPVFAAGYGFILNLCRGMKSPVLSWNDNVIVSENFVGDASGVTLRSKERDSVEGDEVLLSLIPEPSSSDIGGESVVPAEGQPITPTTISSVPSNNSGITPPSPAPQIDEQPESITVSSPDGDTKVDMIQEIPKRIFLGKDNGRDYYWEFGHPHLNNRHLLIFGSSGMGKTYAIQAILCEFARAHQSSLVVDYTNGFLPNQLAKASSALLLKDQRFVINDKLPLDPFLKLKRDLGGGFQIEDTAMNVAKRVTSIFSSVYSLGDQQQSVLIDAIQTGVEKGQMTLDRLISILKSFLDDNDHKKSVVQSLISKLKPFVLEKMFSGEQNTGWDKLFSDKESFCHIFQLAGLDKETTQLLIEFILWDLYAFACNSSTEKTPKVIVLDEVQNLDQRLEAPLGKILTEGRKFGLGLISATQTLSNLDKDQQARLFQAGHKLFFAPNGPEANQYAELVMQVAGNGSKEEWKKKLMSLSKGECLSIGPVLNENTNKIQQEVHRITIASLEERGF